jgi:hypothetical protein
MKRLNLLVVIVFTIVSISQLSAGDSFKFPSTIKYKLLKNDRVVGSCRFEYEVKGKFENTSSLKLVNFEGLGLTSQEWLLTYIYTTNSSIYGTFILKGKEPVSEIRLKEGVGFDGGKGQIFVYKELTSPDQIQTELFTQYPVIDFLTSFFVTSRKVAAGNHTKAEKFNFFFGKSTKIMDMMYMGAEQVPYQGKEVSTQVLIVRYNNVEIFRFKIFNDPDGYYFPLSVAVVTDFTGSNQDTFEMRAEEIKK